jgi:protein-S-isoprenylcysteine O-methyltransferase Ste14
LSNSKRRIHHDNHANRSDLGGEHPLGDMLQVIFLIIFLILWGVDSFYLHLIPILAENIPLYIRLPLSIIIFLIGYVIGKKGLEIVFGEIRDPPVVIREGVFNKSRHPVYFAAILIFSSFVISTLSILAISMWVLIIGLYILLANDEEKRLISKFGDEYKKYQAEVPKWIPKL